MSNSPACFVAESQGCVYGLAELPGGVGSPAHAAIVLDGSDSMDDGNWAERMDHPLTSVLAELLVTTVVDCYMLGQKKPFAQRTVEQMCFAYESFLKDSALAAMRVKRNGSFLRPTLDAISQASRDRGSTAVYVLSDGLFYDDLINSTPASYPSLQLTGVDLSDVQSQPNRARFLPGVFRFSRIVRPQDLKGAPQPVNIQFSAVWQGLEMLHMELRLAGRSESVLIPVHGRLVAAAAVASAEWASGPVHVLFFRALPVAVNWSVSGTLSSAGKLAFSPGADARAIKRRVAALGTDRRELLRGLWRAVESVGTGRGGGGAAALWQPLLASDDAELAGAARALLCRVWLKDPVVESTGTPHPYLAAHRFFPDLPASTLTLRSSAGAKAADAVFTVYSQGPGQGRIETIENWLTVAPDHFGVGETQVKVRAKVQASETIERLRAPLLLSVGEEIIVLHTVAEFI